MPQKSFPRSPAVQSDWLESISFNGGMLTLNVWSAESDSIKEVKMPFTPGSRDASVMIAMSLHKRGLSWAPICTRNLDGFLQELG